MSDETQGKKKSGCWKYLAIGCACVIVLSAIGGYIAYRGVKGFVTGMVTQYTAVEPQKLPTVECADQEAKDVIDRFDEFAISLKENRPAQELSLTSKDINILIQKDPKLKELAGKAFISVEGDKLSGEVSAPLDQLGSMFKGRYLNGSAVFRLEMAAGRLLLFVDSLSVKGTQAPEELMKALRARNLAEDAFKNPEFAAMVEKLESVTVRDGVVTIKPKSAK